MKVALVYDRVNKWGGAERVLLALHKIFPNAQLFTSVYNKKTAEWANVFNVKPSFLQNIRLARASNELFPIFMPLAFETLDLSTYDLVISVTSESAKGIITPPKTLHICICLTPTRYLWSGYNDYFRAPLIKMLAAPFVYYLRYWDKIAAVRPDYIISISKNVEMRIRRYYGRQSTVIYPPVELKEKSTRRKTGKSDYFLVVSRVSRFAPHKKLEIAIQAANKLHLPLKIVGTGRDIRYYRDISGPTVEFLGRLTDSELSYYYESSCALIFPGIEDFGLVMVEAQAHGTPVIAYRGGGALEIIKEGKTGEFFDKPTTASLIKTLEKFRQKQYNSEHCIRNAERFSFGRFKKELLAYIESVLGSKVY